MNKIQRINNLTPWAQSALFGVSYSPLFLILVAKIIYSKSDYLVWGGFSLTSVMTFFQQFWSVVLIVGILLFSAIGTISLLRNLKKTASDNSQKITIKNMTDKSVETINYIATYIIPFVYDVQNDFDIAIMLVIFIVIYCIYTNSSLVAINPILAMRYGLYEMEFEEKGKSHSIIVIACNRDLIEGDEIDIYAIGRKLYFSKTQ